MPQLSIQKPSFSKISHVRNLIKGYCFSNVIHEAWMICLHYMYTTAGYELFKPLLRENNVQCANFHSNFLVIVKDEVFAVENLQSFFQFLHG